jgi:hypothetical protein
MTSLSQEAPSDTHADYSIHSLLPREINLPTYKQSVKTYYELGNHAGQTDETCAAFKDTYGTPCTNNNSQALNNTEVLSLVEFMRQWYLRHKTIWVYLGNKSHSLMIFGRPRIRCC